ncbi:hypothetical protein BZA70DRAFT_117724 [Myxozyma melibiosi]|uniref:PHD and RING finger domain-containing protein n=1 Tax=Myxozyma melibiosi TaxID=54550 RepID=A0ABR1FAP4_9ASCO
MEEYPCIICLLGLPTEEDPRLKHELDDSAAPDAVSDSKTNQPEGSAESADELTTYDGTNDIARLVPCGHLLHNSCIKMWIEQATSCPTCRANFNVIEILHTISGPTMDSYAVETKVQTVDADEAFDESLLDFEDDSAPCLCLVCDFGGREDELLLCDSCDAPYHASCLGMDGVPAEAWYCPSCVDNHAVTDTVMREANTRSARASRRARASRAARTIRTPSRRAGSARGGASTTVRSSRQWDRAWQLVWDRLNRDLDEPQDAAADQEVEATSSRSRRSRRGDNRSRQQREADEWRVWSLRLRIAEANGGSSYFRSTASLFFNSGADDEKESPEMIESWSMLEQALDLEESANPAASPSDGMRHRPSRTFADWHCKRGSTASDQTVKSESPDASRKFKRPRVSNRRSEQGSESEGKPLSIAPVAPTPAAVASVPVSSDGQSLMKSLLQDIRKPPSPSSESHPVGLVSNGRLPTGETMLPTPRSMSPPPPFVSPVSTPRNIFRSPSGSPVLAPSLGSIPSPPAEQKSPVLAPSMSPVHHSRSSPSRMTLAPETTVVSSPAVAMNATASSPSGQAGSQLTLEEKTQIQEIVRDVLRPHYKSGDITKDQYTDINKRVSHVLYALIIRDRDVGLHEQVSEGLEERKQVWINVAKANVESEVVKNKAG